MKTITLIALLLLMWAGAFVAGFGTSRLCPSETPPEPKTVFVEATRLDGHLDAAMQWAYDMGVATSRGHTSLPLLMKYAEDRAISELRNVEPPSTPRPYRFQFVLHSSGTNWDEAAEMAMDDLEEAARYLEQQQWTGFGEAYFHSHGHALDGGYILCGDRERKESQ